MNKIGDNSRIPSAEGILLSLSSFVLYFVFLCQTPSTETEEGEIARKSAEMFWSQSGT